MREAGGRPFQAPWSTCWRNRSSNRTYRSSLRPIRNSAAPANSLEAPDLTRVGCVNATSLQTSQILTAEEFEHPTGRIRVLPHQT